MRKRFIAIFLSALMLFNALLTTIGITASAAHLPAQSHATTT